MNHRLAYLIVAGFALAAGPHAAIAASPERHSVLGTSTSSLTALLNHVTRMTGAGTSRRGRGENTPFGCAIPTASVWPWRCRSTGSTPSMRARRPRLAPANGCSARTRPSPSAGGRRASSQARRFEFTTEARSYGQALGKTANLGVISAVFFKERAATIMRDTWNDDRRQRAPAPAPPSSCAGRSKRLPQPRARPRRADEEFAATGMGRRTDHAVTQVWLDLEDAPAQTVNIRYEFRPQLVRLGILPSAPTADPLQRRERARGFEPGFSPEPPRQR